jgi:UDP-GlcNAc3NAcA epimerase
VLLILCLINFYFILLIFLLICCKYMAKILTIVGARPQFIKASIVSSAIRSCSASHEVVVHTGQHFDGNMSDVFFDSLDMRAPDYFLGIHGGLHGAMTARMLTEIEQILLREKPDAVLVYGDTNSTLAGALAASKLHIPIAHVEAGLRSFNMFMPEEVNRILTDRISTWLYTPTDLAVSNLKREGFAENQIISVGDVMYDVALHFGRNVHSFSGQVAELGLSPHGYVLATVHRAENTDHPERLTSIVNGLIAISKEVPVVWPLHPRTRAALRNIGLIEPLRGKITLIDPVGYLEMVQLEKYAAVIATDSGGVQKEAFFYQVPCVTLRDQTEWSELVDAGWNRLAPPTSSHAVYQAIFGSLGRRGADIQPYGAGNAAQIIVSSLVNELAA